MPPKKKLKFKTDNRMGWLGEYNEKKHTIKINKKRHKGDKKELASTIKHELMHAKHPKMWEKTVYKKTCKSKLMQSEVKKLLSKLRGK